MKEEMNNKNRLNRIEAPESKTVLRMTRPANGDAKNSLNQRNPTH